MGEGEGVHDGSPSSAVLPGEVHREGGAPGHVPHGEYQRRVAADDVTLRALRVRPLWQLCQGGGG